MAGANSREARCAPNGNDLFRTALNQMIKQIRTEYFAVNAGG